MVCFSFFVFGSLVVFFGCGVGFVERLWFGVVGGVGRLDCFVF